MRLPPLPSASLRVSRRESRRQATADKGGERGQKSFRLTPQRQRLKLLSMRKPSKAMKRPTHRPAPVLSCQPPRFSTRVEAAGESKNGGGGKPVIGILGGICSGKSTVAAEFARLGCKVIDADKIAHQLLDKKAISKKLIKLFGQKMPKEAALPNGRHPDPFGTSRSSTSRYSSFGISGRTGKISRRKLAKIVFADRKKLLMLNKIIHPLVLAKAERLIKQYERLPGTKAIVLDMPLLVEVGWHKRCDKLIFVNCSRQKRLKRAEKMVFFAPLSNPYPWAYRACPCVW